MTTLAITDEARAAAVLGTIAPGSATMLYGRTVERSRHDHYRIERSAWLPLKLAASALYTLGQPTTAMAGARKDPTPIAPIYPTDGLWALSTSGPHAYQLCMGDKFHDPNNIKEAEFRTWKTNLKDIIVLIHVYTNPRFDHLFREYGIAPEKAPKSAIIGAAVLEGCHWDEEDRLYGHQMAHPILFEKPIRGVPGKHRYWRPEEGETHLIRAFNKSWEQIQAHG